MGALAAVGVDLVLRPDHIRHDAVAVVVVVHIGRHGLDRVHRLPVVVEIGARPFLQRGVADKYALHPCATALGVHFDDKQTLAAWIGPHGGLIVGPVTPLRVPGVAPGHD